MTLLKFIVFLFPKDFSFTNSRLGCSALYAFLSDIPLSRRPSKEGEKGGYGPHLHHQPLMYTDEASDVQQYQLSPVNSVGVLYYQRATSFQSLRLFMVSCLSFYTLRLYVK